MASLIKNQILKHLSKFAKNLSVDQITVEVLKGKGAMENIELNEVVLTEVLELPAWLRVQKATCNKIAVKIPWTSLKTSAVKLFIDEIHVEVVMSSDLLQERLNTSSPSTPGSSTEQSTSAAYGFANRVAEGMSLYINTVEVFFTSEKFGGSFLLSRLCVESRTPTWKEASDLHQTRIRDHRLQEVLVFKQVSWQLLRIEASNISSTSSETVGGRSAPSGSHNINAPLRLITNQGHCRISMKKSTVDGLVISGRLQLILGDILWVATLPQVRSAINFYTYVMELVQKAAEVNKVQKAEKLLQQADLSTRNVSAGSKLVPPAQSRGASGGSISEVFQKYDVAETSYHFYGARIDLHICDEASEETGLSKTAAEGAIQLSMQKLSIDCYPYHLAAGERTSWIYYKDRACRQWILSSLDSYYELFSSKLDAKTRAHFQSEWPKLMAQCWVIRLDDISVYCLTKAGDKASSEKLLSCDREVLKLPDDMPVLHAEFSDYYYASEQCKNLPLPPSNTHAQWNPIRVFLDHTTLRWISSVYLDICNTLGLKTSGIEGVPHHDVHVEALMPRLVVPMDNGNMAKVSSGYSVTRPTLLVIQAADVVLENTSIVTSSSRVQQVALKHYVSQLEDYLLFAGANEELIVGGCRLSPLPTQTEAFRRYLTTLCEREQCKIRLDDNQQSAHASNKTTENGEVEETITSNGSAATDIWTVSLSPVWIDFYRPDSVHYPRQLPFISDVPLTIWLVPNIINPSSSGSGEPTAATLTVLVRVDGAVKVLMECDQYRFLHNVLNDLAELVKVLVNDAGRLIDNTRSKGDNVADNTRSKGDHVAGIATGNDRLMDNTKSGYDPNQAPGLSCCLCCLAPSVDVTFLLPVVSDAPEFANGTNEQEISKLDLSANVSITNATANDLNNLSVGAIPMQEQSYDPQPVDGTPNELRPGSYTPSIDVASIDIALGSVAMEDTVSVITDVSDMDEDHFVQVDSPDVAPFDDVLFQRGGQRTMEAMDAYEEEKERLCDHSRTTAMIDLTTRLLQKKVSTVTFHLRQCQLAFTYAGDESRLISLVPQISSEENHDITLEDAHRLLNTKAPTTPEHYRNVDRLLIGTFPLEIRAGFRDTDDPGYLHMDLRNLELKLRQENLIHLSNFLEMEASPGSSSDTGVADSSMEIRVRIMDATVLILDPVAALPPTRVQVDRVRVSRTNEKGTQLKLLDHEEKKVEEIERENAELRRQLEEAKELIQRLSNGNIH